MSRIYAYLLVLGSLIASLQSAEKAASVDLECPDHFHVTQDRALRAFRVAEEGKHLGTILSSDYGVFDFYNEQGEKLWVNRFDSLFDCAGTCIAHVRLESDGFFHSSTWVEILSANEELLVIVQAEGDGKCFVFRDGKNKKPLAVALWSWMPTGTYWPSWRDYYVQNWEVMLIDGKRLDEKKIPAIFLIWALLKHSQKHFPNPDEIKYQTTLPEKKRRE